MNYLIARVSDENQRKALPAQKKQLLEYADRQRWVRDRDYRYVEFDESAFHDTRKKFRELVIEPLQQEKEPAIVVFAKIDRYSRDSSSEEKADLTKLWKQGKIAMHFPADNLFINKDSPAADLFRLDIGIALAGYYSSAIRDNVRRRFDQMVSDGIWIGKAPIGYLNYVKGKDAKGNTIKSIKLDPERYQHIIEGFKLRSTGMSYGAIAKDRKFAGLVSNTSKKTVLSKAKWEAVLNNPFYIGRLRYMGKEYPHNYPVIIDQWLWNKCQLVREQRKHAKTKYRSKPFLLKKIKCAECGCTVSFDGPKGPGRNVYGRCTAFTQKHVTKNVNEKVLIEQVKERLKVVTVPKSVIPELIKEIERHHESEQEFYISRKRSLQKEYDQLDDELKDLFDDRKQFKTRPDIFESLVKTKGDRQKMLLQELQDHGNGDKAFLLGASYILDICSRAVELFESERSSVEQKRYLLDFVFSNMVLDGEKLLLPLKQPFEVIAKMSESQNWCHIPSMFRKKYYQAIVALAQEVAMAKEYLGSSSVNLVAFDF